MDHDNAIDTGNPGGDRVHQHRAWISRRAAGNIEPDTIHRCPFGTEFHAEFVDVLIIFRKLAAVMIVDAFMGKFEGLQGWCIDLLPGLLQLICGNADIISSEFDTVEFAGKFKKGVVASDLNFRKNRCNGCGHVLSRRSFQAQEAAEILFEIRVTAIEFRHHVPFQL